MITFAKLTDEQKQEISALYLTGTMNHADISAKTGVSICAVSTCLKGVKPAKRKYTNSRGAALAARNADVLRMVQVEGMKVIDVAAKLGMTHQNVSLVLRKNNVPKFFVRKQLGEASRAERESKLEAARVARTAKRQERVTQLAALWAAGESVEKIAQVVGFKSTASMHVHIVRMRAKYPDKFPYRREGWGSEKELTSAPATV